MPLKVRFVRSITTLVLLVSFPIVAAGRGGSGGGGHAGGGGGGGGMRGGRSFAPSAGGYGGGHVAGYRGFGGGYAGRAAGFRGYGPRYGYYGWGYPYYGYGLGLGLGLGLGYGLAGGYGYPAYGYPYYGYSDPAYYSATPAPSAAAASSNPTSISTSVVTAAASAPPQEIPTPDAKSVARSREFAERGEIEFRVGDYEGSIYSFRHAIVDDPGNPFVTLQLGQALFASGKYEEAAGAIQAGLHQLPKEEWGSFVTRYQDYYGNPQEYTHQLRMLEKAISGKPSSPALHFLAGYHYGYLGFFKPSIEQLNKAVQLEPRDEMSKQLKDVMKKRMTKTDALPLPPAPVPAKDL